MLPLAQPELKRWVASQFSLTAKVNYSRPRSAHRGWRGFGARKKIKVRGHVERATQQFVAGEPRVASLSTSVVRRRLREAPRPPELRRSLTQMIVSIGPKLL